MTKKVRLLDEAVAEVEDAALWYEERNAGLGLAFLAAIDRSFDHLSRWPLTGTLVEGVDESLQVRRTTVGSFPYYIAYVTAAQHITVLAVAHERRRPRYWISRAD